MDKRNIRIIFILPNDCETESQTSNEMQQAFEVCKQNGINVDWHREQESSDLQLNKTDFVVFQMFEGEAFDTIKQTESVRIVGPRCLLTCLTEGKQIPNFPWPLYSTSMMECRICSTLPKAKNREIQDKIEYMAGYFSTSLNENCTHLVTDSVKSEKYIKAAEAGVKLLLSSWVEDVWKASQKANIHCNDKQFEKHRCPTFHKLVVCCTGLSLADRNFLEKMITENGGIYREQLHLPSTDILVCDGSSSAKYKAAKKRNIKCVTFQWVEDSIENGYAMPDTPVKEPTSLKRKSNSNEHNELVDKIELKKIKQIGPFLDGCGPLSELTRQFWDKICPPKNSEQAHKPDPPNFDVEDEVFSPPKSSNYAADVPADDGKSPFVTARAVTVTTRTATTHEDLGTNARTQQLEEKTVAHSMTSSATRQEQRTVTQEAKTTSTVVGGDQQQKFLKKPAEDHEPGGPNDGFEPPVKLQCTTQHGAGHQPEGLTKFSVEIVQQLEFTTSAANSQPQQISTNVTVKALTNASAKSDVSSPKSSNPLTPASNLRPNSGVGNSVDIGTLVECVKQEPDNDFADLDQCAALLACCSHPDPSDQFLQ